MEITDKIKYVGVADISLDLFESQYVVPEGVTYNSYIIMDDKITIMDTVDKRASKEWLENVENSLEGKEPTYLVVSHLEPDHSANIEQIASKYPKLQIILSQKAYDMLPQFADKALLERAKPVKEGESINIGENTLTFYMAPMVHWPEVMVTYCDKEKTLFTADGFGKFGVTLDTDDWACEARRYYFNICGRYGAQVQMLLKKAAMLDIEIICPLHGPILKENLEYYINKYDIWSKYEPEDKGIVIFYNSIHGNTRKLVEKLEEIMEEENEKAVSVFDLARCDMAEAIEDAFRYDRMIIASPTYDAGLFPDTENFLRHLAHKGFCNRKIGLIENGSWAPMAAKCMKDIITTMKNVEVAETVVTIKTRMNEETPENLRKLVKELTK